MTNDNTRTKANAVFFSVLMVLSMVGVGFAAAPAAANVGTGSTIDFADQQVDDTEVTTTVNPSVTQASGDATVVVTFDNGTDDVVAGVNTVTGIRSSTDVTVDVSGNLSGLPGTHTAHLFLGDQSSSFSVDDALTATAEDTNDAFVQPDFRIPGDNQAFNGTVVYQGEDEISYFAEDNSPVEVASLAKTSGDASGTTLNTPIGQDTPTGRYAVDGSSNNFNVIVQEPRISTAEVQLNGDDVSQVPTSVADELTINATWNFNEAENIDLTVEDASGSDITNQVLDSATLSAPSSGSAGIGLDLQDEDAGEYTIIFEGSDDLDYGDVAEEYTITTTSQDDIQLELAEDTVTRGTNLEYTVTGGTNNNFHLVTIESSEFRGGISIDEARTVFRNVGETQKVGAYNATNNFEVPSGGDVDNVEYAYAVVQIDGTTAPGAIETQYLDDSTVDIDVYNATTASDADAVDLNTSNYTSEDDPDFDVTEGDVSLTSPTDNYVVGEDVDVTGTASSADDVRVYVKDNNNWEILEVGGTYNITVDSDDTFEETDVDLSTGNGGGNNILAFEGRYEIGVIDLQDAVEVETQSSGLSSSEITTSDWTTSTSSRASINVVEGNLSANFATFNGQIAEEDDIVDVDGTAAGQNSVAVAFVDDRGNTVAYDVSVDSDQTFEEDDLSLSDLNQGTVSAHVISNGRDGNIGDGTVPNQNNDISGLVSFINGLSSNNQLSGDQVRDRIVAETVEDDASDDLIVTQTFRLADGSVSIDSVYPEGSEAAGVNPVAAGDAMVVSGSTNRKADDTSVVIDVLDEDGNALASGSTDEWGSDGMFTVTIDTADLETGSYTIEADTGDNTDQVTFDLVESVEEETTEEETEEETTEEETTEEETTEEETEEETTEEETTEEETTEEETTEEEATDDSTPGFGALVALVALVAAALLATRRRDE